MQRKVSIGIIRGREGWRDEEGSLPARAYLWDMPESDKNRDRNNITLYLSGNLV